MLNFTDVSLTRGGKPLLENVSLTIHAGQRVGIVGRNGSGKSSLLALVRGELEPDAGQVHVPDSLVVASVRQEAPHGDRPAIDYVLDGDAEWRRLDDERRAAEQRGNASALARVHDRLHAIGGYAARSRAGRLMHGLGFAPESHERPIEHFSGGWRMRLNLARTLMCRADLLLLDEPTNHLDLDAVLWLQEHLANHPGTVLLISHDRDFLDGVVNHVLHLEACKAEFYTGGYSDFEARRAERMRQREAEHRNQVKRLEHMRAFVDRFRAKATKARQAQSRLKQIERMELTEPAHWDAPFRFEFRSPDRLPQWLVRLEEASAGYGGQPLLEDLDLHLAPGDRAALLGRNGAGKSTLVRLIAGELDPIAGRQDRHRHLNVGYLAQHHLEQLDPAASPLAHLQRLDPDLAEQEGRDFLGGFGFPGDMALANVAPLSGGEKTRLALAMVVWRRPNLLLLDEPTNHLDLEMRHAVEVALQDFQGAVLLVAHDRHLIDSTCDSLWLVDAGRLQGFDGDLDDYAAWVRRRLAPATGDGRDDSRTAPNARDRRREAAAQRKRQKPVRDVIKRLESEFESLRQRLSSVETELADPSLYQQSPERVSELSRLQGQLRRQMTEAEEAWLDAVDRLETLSSQ